MDTQIVQKRVNDLASAMVAKGMRESAASFDVKSDAEPQVFLSWKSSTGTGGLLGDGTHCKCFRGHGAAALDDAAAFIASQPAAEETRQRDFMAALGRVIDLGRQNGIEADFLNPLVASMKKLSENIITDQRAA